MQFSEASNKQEQEGSYSRETIYTAMTASETETAARPPVGMSAAVEKSATCSWDTGCRMPDARCQKWQKTVW